jgi:hypothetical protein
LASLGFAFAFAVTHAFLAQSLMALFGQRRAVDLVIVDYQDVDHRPSQSA